jgi:parallel beta-helix repeat protein
MERNFMKRLVSGVMLTLLLTSMLTLAFNVRPVKSDYAWIETIYVLADGSIQPPAAPISSVDNVTYTLTDNIAGNVPDYSSAIVIQRDNIIIDGAGYTLQGTQSYHSRGIELTGRSNVTIKNVTITAFFFGIWLGYFSSNNGVSGNTAANNWYGIWLDSSSNNSVSGNTVANNGCGIELEFSSNNSVSGNNITNNGGGIGVSESQSNNISGNNIAANYGAGIQLYESSGYQPSSYNRIVGNNITENGGGIALYGFSSNNFVSENNITNNESGVYLIQASNNTISANNITESANGVGVTVHLQSDYNSISGNNIAHNLDGISVRWCSNTSISENNITDRRSGINLVHSSNNSVAGNVFVNGGLLVGYSYGNVVVDNSVNGKPLVYLEGASDVVVEDAGQVVLVNCTRTKVENLDLSSASAGVQLWGTNSTIVSGNHMTNNAACGIRLWFSPNNCIFENNVSNNEGGIDLLYSSGATLRDNTMVDNEYNLYVDGASLSDYVHDIDVSNTVNGRPVYYWVNRGDATVPLDAGYVGLVNSTRIVVRGLDLTKNGQGLLLAFTTNSTMTENVMADNDVGISLLSSSENGIFGNSIRGNMFGIYLDTSSNNSIFENNITNNNPGVWCETSNYNRFYHNNFIDNGLPQVMPGTPDYDNVWDDGYPSGGNYWSDYTGTDFYSGPYQNENGSDGIGDIPYLIDLDHQDNYPLMKPYPWAIHDVGVTGVTASKNVVGQGYNLSISVIAFNYGEYMETTNFTVYANETAIGEINNVDIASRNSAIVTFAWSTTGFAEGNYTISAYAEPVQGETYTADNNCTGGTVTITVAGDVTGEGLCDMQDISIMIDKFMTAPPVIIYDPNVDVNNDLSIDMADISIAIDHFMQS